MSTTREGRRARSGQVWRARSRRFLSLGWKERSEAAALVLAATAAEVAVRTVRLPTLARRLGITLEDADEVPKIASRRDGLDAATIDRRAAAVDRIYRAWPRKDSCLRRALVVGFYVRRAHPVLRIGVERRDDDVHAHAWIEVDGRVIGEERGGFAPLRRRARLTP